VNLPADVSNGVGLDGHTLRLPLDMETLFASSVSTNPFFQFCSEQVFEYTDAYPAPAFSKTLYTPAFQFPASDVPNLNYPSY
jgi:hypothetical protein